jgi:hypothetical protein
MNSSRWGWALPFIRFPVPANAQPETVRAENLRAMVVQWTKDLTEVDAVLAPIKDVNLKLPVHFFRVRLDLDEDGVARQDESLGDVFLALSGGSSARLGDPGDFVIGFDYADALWLRAYCHLLGAIAEAILAYDGKEVFDHCAHLVFPKPDIPYTFLKTYEQGRFDFPTAIDAITFIHLWRMPLKEPERLKIALVHLEEMIRLSRRMWKAIEAETDDDHEWIPNARQHSVMPSGGMTEEMINGWKEFLDEAEAILAGKKLIPFWRGDSRGVNLRKVFTEPRAFDLVLWAQGTAAAPYLENGPQTNPSTWQRFQNIFGGRFIGFAAWIN